MMSQRMRNALVDTMLVGTVVLLLVFFYAPIATLVAFSFTSSRVLTRPSKASPCNGTANSSTSRTSFPPS